METENQRPYVGPGEFCEFAIFGHPSLERSAPKPWHDFPWPEVFERLDGPDPSTDQREHVCQMLNEILRGIVSPHRGKHATFAAGLRCLGLSVALGIERDMPGKLVRTYKQRIHTARWRSRKKGKA